MEGVAVAAEEGGAATGEAGVVAAEEGEAVEGGAVVGEAGVVAAREAASGEEARAGEAASNIRTSLSTCSLSA